MDVLGVQFTGACSDGDFGTRILKWDDEVLAFNDNRLQFKKRCLYNGGGNSCVRFLRGKRSFGIPTGDESGGYQILTKDVKDDIDESFQDLDEMLAKARAAGRPFKRLVYSAGPDGVMLGDGIFNVGQPVKAYITTKLLSYATPKAPTRTWMSHAQILAANIKEHAPNWRRMTWLELSKNGRLTHHCSIDFLKEMFGRDMLAFEVMKELGLDAGVLDPGSVECEMVKLLGQIEDVKKTMVVLAILCKEPLQYFHVATERAWSAAHKCLEQQKEEQAAAALFA